MIRCAIAGYGWWGQQIAHRLTGSNRIDIGLVVEPAPEPAALAAKAGYRVAGDLEAALADDRIDAAILTTPNALHEAQVAACAAAGKHVMCEKPLALTGDGAKRSVAACREAGVVLALGHERRFEPAMVELKARIDRGELGTIMHACADYSHDRLSHLPRDSWRVSPEHGPSAPMTATGIHMTDLMIWSFGRVASVAALRADRVLGWPTGEVVTVQLGFEAGMTANVTAVLKTAHLNRYNVFGAKAWAEVRNTTHPEVLSGPAEFSLHRDDRESERITFEWTDAVRDNLEAFAAAVEGDAPNPYTDAELVHNTEVLEAIGRSASTGTTVHLGRRAEKSSPQS